MTDMNQYEESSRNRALQAEVERLREENEQLRRFKDTCEEDRSAYIGANAGLRRQIELYDEECARLRRIEEAARAFENIGGLKGDALRAALEEEA